MSAAYVDSVVDVLLVAVEHVEADGERLDAALRAPVARLLLFLFLLLLFLLLLLLVVAVSVLLLALLLRENSDQSMARDTCTVTATINNRALLLTHWRTGPSCRATSANSARRDIPRRQTTLVKSGTRTCAPIGWCLSRRTTYDLLRVRVVLLRLGRGRRLLLHLDGVLFGRLGLLVGIVVQQGHRRLVQSQFRSRARGRLGFGHFSFLNLFNYSKINKISIS